MKKQAAVLPATNVSPYGDLRAIKHVSSADLLPRLGTYFPFVHELSSDSPCRAPVPLRIATAGLLLPRGKVCRSSPSVVAHTRVSDFVPSPQESCCGRPFAWPHPIPTVSPSMSIRQSSGSFPPRSPPSWSETR